jgi:hypothetical protein
VQAKAQQHAEFFNRRVQGLETKAALRIRFLQCWVVSVSTSCS